jgi:hypothetical protein
MAGRWEISELAVEVDKIIELNVGFSNKPYLPTGGYLVIILKLMSIEGLSYHPQ